MRDNVDQWHLDKRVPLALILAIFVQTSTAVWWASSVNSRMVTTERSIERLDRQGDTLRNATQVQAVQLGRIEEQITGLRADIGRMIEALNK